MRPNRTVCTQPSTAHGVHSAQYSTWSTLSPIQHMEYTQPSTAHGVHSAQYSTRSTLSPVQHAEYTQPSIARVSKLTTVDQVVSCAGMRQSETTQVGKRQYKRTHQREKPTTQTEMDLI